jgi:hypothetical protein
MNDSGALCLREESGRSYIAMVKDNGGNRLFAQPIMDAKPTTFREILGTVSHQGVFHFPNTRSLANFAEKVSIHYGHDSDLM